MRARPAPGVRRVLFAGLVLACCVVAGHWLRALHTCLFAKPVYLYSSKTPWKSSYHQVPCSQPCFMNDDDQGLQHWILVKDSPIRILRSMEGSSYFPDVDALKFRLEHPSPHILLSSTSFKSDFPITYYTGSNFSPYAEQTARFRDRQMAAAFMARNCKSHNNREALVRELGQYITVHAVSDCLHNHDAPRPPAGHSRRGKIQTLATYRVYLAFENQNVDDYVTEKVFDGLESGAVPVYLGASNVEDGFVPAGSVIAVNKYPTVAALAEHLRRVLSDEHEWQRYQQWRKKRPDPKFQARYEAVNGDHLDCRICKGVAAREEPRSWVPRGLVGGAHA